MQVYWGNAGKHSDITIIQENGWGIMYSGNWNKKNSRLVPIALDNGAFTSYRQNKPYDSSWFLRNIQHCIDLNIVPDFIIVPDIVGAGEDSLSFSLEWMQKLCNEFPKYLAVQDGMTIDMIPCELFDGIFIGGTISWKMRMGEMWVNYAHENNMKCHIGRVGTYERIRWALRIGADSIDSSSWPQNNSWEKHLKRAFQDHNNNYNLMSILQ